MSYKISLKLRRVCLIILYIGYSIASTQEDDMTKQLTLRQKIGQLLIVGMPGTQADEPYLQKLMTYATAGEVGGFIPYGYNIESPQQIQALNHALRQAAHTGKLPPFLLAVDVEGGQVDRLSEAKGFGPSTPPAEDVAQKSIQEAHSLYAHMVKKVKENGFNWVYAPDVDMNVNDNRCPVIGAMKRSYGLDPATIVKYASILIEEARKIGLLTCAKHFPGHGSARSDTHKGFTDITDVWDRRELDPFFELCQKGLLDSVMTGHLFNSHLDAVHQATMSRPTLQLLRDAGFDGVIVSDDLHMGAIQEKYTFSESIEQSLSAGVDMIIFSNNLNAAKRIPGFQPDPDLPKNFCDVVEKAIHEGRLSTARINEAFERVQRLKKRLKA